jgi:molybdate transport repressor ModE-like protein
MAPQLRDSGYKEITLAQMRSFCETARLGSLKAAANSLGLAHPTVWQQVHVLERLLAARLLEPHGRGCRLTDEGRLLAELAHPLVAGMDALKRNFQEARGSIRPRLTVATTQRTLTEDLAETIVEFERRHPQVLLCFKEVGTWEVLTAVESGDADLGVTPARKSTSRHPGLRFEPAYELDVILVTPRDHPLARRRRITPKDLLGFPLVNAPNSWPDPVTRAALEKLGVFETEPRRVEAVYTATIRRCVELGFGIGLVIGLPAHACHPELHQRSLSRYFGCLTVNLVWREGAESAFASDFAELLRTQLQRPAK